MRAWCAGMLALVFGAVLILGCDDQKNQPPVTNAPPQPAAPPAYPSDPGATHANPPQAEPPPVAAAPEEPLPEPPPPAPVDSSARKAKPRSARSSAAPRESYAAPSKSGRTYTVKNGDTLQKISQKFYGTTKNWRKIYNANKSKLKDPNSLKVGTKLSIP